MTNIILCGCGALGSHIAMGIAREAYHIALYDDDKVDIVNVRTGTTVYSTQYIGQWKADALAVMLTRRYDLYAYPLKRTVCNPVTIVPLEVRRVDLIIDCFDNIKARFFTIVPNIPTVHISIGEHGIGAIEWDNVFQLPSEGYARGENPVCTNELGRNLILFTSAVASVIINKYLSTGVKESAYVNVDKLEIFK